MLRLILFINTLILLTASAVLIFFPAFLIPGISTLGAGQELGQSLARNYGFASLAIAVLSGLMASRPLTDETKYVGIGALAAFHLGMTLSQMLNIFEGNMTIIVVAIHAVFALIFLAIFIWQYR